MSARVRYRLALAAALAVLPSAGRAQVNTLRGSVVDEQRQPLPGVQLEMEFLGESRQKVVKTLLTDKKGGFVRMGLQAGRWRLRFTKEGFAPRGLETDVSLGGVSEIPPVTLKAASAPAASLAALLPGGPAPPDVARELAATYLKASEAMQTGRDQEAQALFEQVLATDAGVGAAHFNLGLLAMKRNDVPAAEAAFRKAIELRPQQANAYLALAVLLGKAARPDEAFALLQGAAGSFEAEATFQFALGIAAINAGREAEAQAALEKAATLDPAHAETQYYLGTLAVGRSEVKAAITHFETYLALAPEGPNADAARKLLEALKPRR